MRCNIKYVILALLGLWLTSYEALGQKFGQIELIPYGDMDHWLMRTVKESAVIGAEERTLYEVTGSTVKPAVNEPYLNRQSPWATSNALAKVHGITKGSNTVFPERRGGGYAARLETHLEQVKVLGLVNINVIAAGTLFLGSLEEPITNTDHPYQTMNQGIPFNKRPQFLQFDYKLITGGSVKRVNGVGLGSSTGQKDLAEVQIILQHRWEDGNGQIHAHRVGTGWERFPISVSTWQNQHRIPIHYGNFKGDKSYQPYMNLIQGAGAYYAKNSKGKMVPILEEGWGQPGEKITHLIVQFSSSGRGPYIGNEQSKFWVDNVILGY